MGTNAVSAELATHLRAIEALRAQYTAAKVKMREADAANDARRAAVPSTAGRRTLPHMPRGTRGKPSAQGSGPRRCGWACPPPTDEVGSRGVTVSEKT